MPKNERSARPYKEPDRSGTRYVVPKNGSNMLEDTTYKKMHQLLPISGEDEHFDSLVDQLVKVANRRSGRFDPLMNSQDCLDALVVYLAHKSPALLESGLLQPLIDLTAAVHNRIVGKLPELFNNRSREMDGRFRWLESVGEQEEYYRDNPEALEAAKRENPGAPLSFSEIPDRPIQVYSDKIEAFILITFQAISIAHEERLENAREKQRRIDGIMDRLFVETRIRNTDKKKFHDRRDSEDQTFLSGSTVRRWMRTITYEDRAKYGRTYCYNALFERYRSELAACRGNPENAQKLAKEILMMVRPWQPTHFPKVGTL